VTPQALRAWAATLRPDDELALEATGDSDSIAVLRRRWSLGSGVEPERAAATVEAKVETGKVDALILAPLLAADFLPPVSRRSR
jgi:transposase